MNRIALLASIILVCVAGIACTGNDESGSDTVLAAPPPDAHPSAPLQQTAPVPTATPAPLCVPGASVACACTDGSAGAQVCNQAGNGFEKCVCAQPAQKPTVNDVPKPATVSQTGTFSILKGQTVNLTYSTFSTVVYALTYQGYDPLQGVHVFSAEVTESKDAEIISSHSVGKFGLNAEIPNSPNTESIQAHFISSDGTNATLTWGVYLY